MRVKADTLSKGVFLCSTLLVFAAVVSLFFRMRSTEDHRLLAAPVLCNGCLCNITSSTFENFCSSSSSKLKVAVPYTSLKSKGSMMVSRIFIPNQNNVRSLTLDVATSITRQFTSSSPPLEMNQKENEKITALCTFDDCISDIVHRIEIEDNVNFIIESTIEKALDSQNRPIILSSELNFSMKFFAYSSKDGFILSLFKLCLVILSILFFIKFTRNLKPVRLQEKLTVQMFTKYIGFLAIFFNFPIVIGITRSKNVYAILVMIFESLFFSYLAVFFLIMMPSIAKEHSTAITQYNTAWKKMFLLIYFAIGLASRIKYLQLLESDPGADRSDQLLFYLRASSVCLTAGWIAYVLFFSIVSLRKMSALETRNKVLFWLAFPSSILAGSTCFGFGSLFGEYALHGGLTLFVVSLEIYFSREVEMLDGQQPTSGPQKLEILGVKHNQSDSVGHTEDSREDTEGNFYNKSLDDVKKVEHQPQEEEVSYEIEREDQ